MLNLLIALLQAAPPGIDLSGWKLTLPVAERGRPREILQPELPTFRLPPYFRAEADALVFHAPADGATTPGSSYPRCELREMEADGSTPAAWSTEQGVHAMTITQAITRLPARKPHVVAGQIHDAKDDVVMIRLEGRRLFVEGGGKELGVLDPDYALGTEFTVRIEASEGRVRVYHRDLAAPKVDVARRAVGCYFKAGVYVQSNPSKGEPAGEVGELRIRALSVTHAP